MLATALPSGSTVVFPIFATPKIDGIRAMIVGGKLVSRTLKPIPNRAASEALECMLPEGADGELVYGDTFQSATSAVMTVAFLPPPTTKFTFYWFDYVRDTADAPYEQRMANVQEYCSTHDGLTSPVVKIVQLHPKSLQTSDALDAFEAQVLDEGFEGVMLRKPGGRYKFGRSTVKEGLLLKLKRFEDAEAQVIGVEELRRSDGEDKIPGGVLGALVCITQDKVQFKIGTGFSAHDRQELWKQRRALIGRQAKYKFLLVGVKTAPRHPVFLGFRDPMDMS